MTAVDTLTFRGKPARVKFHEDIIWYSVDDVMNIINQNRTGADISWDYYKTRLEKQGYEVPSLKMDGLEMVCIKWGRVKHQL